MAGKAEKAPPDAGRVAARVDDDDFLVVAEGGRRDEWAEHFFLRHARAWTGANDRRLDVTALRQLLTLGWLAAQQDLTAPQTAIGSGRQPRQDGEVAPRIKRDHIDRSPMPAAGVRYTEQRLRRNPRDSGKTRQLLG